VLPHRKGSKDHECLASRLLFICATQGWLTWSAVQQLRYRAEVVHESLQMQGLLAPPALATQKTCVRAVVHKEVASPRANDRVEELPTKHQRCCAGAFLWKLIEQKTIKLRRQLPKVCPGLLGCTVVGGVGGSGNNLLLLQESNLGKKLVRKGLGLLGTQSAHRLVEQPHLAREQIHITKNACVRGCACVCIHVCVSMGPV